MINQKNSFYAFLSLVLVCAACAVGTGNKSTEKPTLYIIGDSTVRNTGEGAGGWGSYIAAHFDSTKLAVSNQAMAGRSTRTFIKEGRWNKVLSTLKPGDYVIMQFGHNEGSEPDTTRAGYRGVLRGIGDETKELTWKDGQLETVHTYGWYLRKFVHDAKAKGATPIIASMIPRNQWKDGKVIRATDTFGKWAREIAEQEGAYFIDLNQITADKYDAWGPDQVKKYFPKDHTHTDVAGARINAASVAEGIKQHRKLGLNKYFLKN
ncbi:rhamnogalacturonan acetylesterase [Pontibacter beigongshangensis]|uniref:rhamnogalacturonan acetylesterase n=1 Tax=Pontibacter beigongshangensis TaxID=2574733 RepID=UPI00164FCEB1|nr:rhamnogalacturonan acetylesterase [Pontibacter beigongshangensis]